jgi:ABC-type sugar transport system substrate-binding protein
MPGIKVFLSLINHDNAFQRAQAASAEEVARNRSVTLETVFAGGDAVNQVQQILTAIQRKDHGIDIVIVQPVGTSMANVADVVTKGGVAWGVLNRELEYLSSLRRSVNVPVFEVTVDQVETGHIEAQQVASLCPQGGTVLYITGPTVGSTARLRNEGFLATKPGNITVKGLKGNWTEESGYNAIRSCLRLSTFKSSGFVGIVCQNDEMAMGARRAFSEVAEFGERRSWLDKPFLGCDGLPDNGQREVRAGNLAATIVTPTVAGLALEAYCKFRQDGQPVAERTAALPVSFPEVSALRMSAMAPTR